jgi:hypothetical protein
MHIDASAEIGASDGFMHVSFHPNRLNPALSAGIFGVITGHDAWQCQNVLLSFCKTP